MKILITGSSGLIGGFIYSHLNTNHARLGIDIINSETTDKLVDIRDKNCLKAILVEFEPDMVIHIAAQKDLIQCEENKSEAWHSNVDPLTEIADHLSLTAGKLIYISSDMVFDGTKGNYSEEDPTCPINWYGATKMVGELVSVIRMPEDSISILRTAQVFGPVTEALIDYVNTKIDCDTMTNQSALPLFIKMRLSRGLPVMLPSNIFSSPTPVTLIADVVNKIIENETSTGLLHVAGPDSYSRFELGRKIAELLELPKDLVVDGVDATAHLRPRDLSMNINKLEQLLDIKKTEYDILDYIKQQIKYAQ